MVKLPFNFLFSFLFLFNVGTAQEVISNKRVPKEYDRQFKEDQKRFLEFINPYEKKSGEAYNFWNYVKKGYNKCCDVDSLFRVYLELKEIELIKRVEFIKLNPTSYASLYYFEQRVLRSTSIKPDSLLTIFSNLEQDLQATPLGKQVFQSIKQKQVLMLGKEMPDFSFITINGQSLNLSFFRGQKHILLCFWASWCGPCVKNIPFLKAIEEQYRDKGLQLIHISIDSDTTKWFKAVEKHQMPWLQTCELPPYISANLSMLYQIDYIPSYFLIDTEGKLIYQSLILNDHEDYSGLKNLLQGIFGKSPY